MDERRSQKVKLRSLQPQNRRVHSALTDRSALIIELNDEETIRSTHCILHTLQTPGCVPFVLLSCCHCLPPSPWLSLCPLQHFVPSFLTPRSPLVPPHPHPLNHSLTHVAPPAKPWADSRWCSNKWRVIDRYGKYEW